MNSNKQKYELIFNIIRTELNKVDPMGLCPGEFAPINEYDPETAMVVNKIKDVENYVELAKEISIVFDEMFGEKFDESSFYNCAHNILEEVNKL
ncbi:MAG: DUF1871 family protein [Clostridiales bacterium]|nr:DUF1871 family protein [Clostridiales bacterium]